MDRGPVVVQALFAVSATTVERDRDGAGLLQAAFPDCAFPRWKPGQPKKNSP